MTRMSRYRRLLAQVVLPSVLLGLVAGFAGLTAFTPAQAAAAPPVLGSLLFTPATGLASSPISLTTVSAGAVRGCPADSVNVAGVVTGPGDWAKGVPATSNTDVGVSSIDDFSIIMLDTFSGLAATNVFTIVPGKYTITLNCQDVLGVSISGSFVGSVWFTTATAYQSTDPNAPTPTVTPTPTAGPTTTATPTATVTPSGPATPTISPTPSVTPTQTPIPTPTLTPTTSPAGTLGALAFNPPTGLDSSPINLTTVSSGAAKGCPPTTVNAAGVVTGPGDWAKGFTVTANSDAGVSSTADFSVIMLDTFNGLAATNSLALVPGKYTVTLNCQDELGVTIYGSFVGSIWFTDATHYQSTDPSSSQTPTETVIAAAPADRADVGSTVTLTASISPAAAAGTVQFRDDQGGTFGDVGKPVPVSGGSASLSSKTFAFGLYRFSAVFTPADAAKFTPSTSKELVYALAKPRPPVPKGTAKVVGKLKVGRTVTCSGVTFTGAKTVRYQWFRDGRKKVGSTRTHRLGRKDGRHLIRCRVLGTNSGGTTTRTSRPVRVAR